MSFSSAVGSGGIEGVGGISLRLGESTTEGVAGKIVVWSSDDLRLSLPKLLISLPALDSECLCLFVLFAVCAAQFRMEDVLSNSLSIASWLRAEL